MNQNANLNYLDLSTQTFINWFKEQKEKSRQKRCLTEKYLREGSLGEKPMCPCNKCVRERYL